MLLVLLFIILWGFWDFIISPGFFEQKSFTLKKLLSGSTSSLSRISTGQFNSLKVTKINYLADLVTAVALGTLKKLCCFTTKFKNIYNRARSLSSSFISLKVFDYIHEKVYNLEFSSFNMQMEAYGGEARVGDKKVHQRHSLRLKRYYQ